MTFLLALALALSAQLSLPAAGQNSQHDFNSLSSEGSSGGFTPAADDIWSQIDQEIDLDGLWGSIDTEHDVDPFVVADGGSGTTHLLWAKWNGVRHRVVHAWRLAGGAWSGPEAVEADGGSAEDSVTPRGVLDVYGRLNVAWTRTAGGASSVYHAARLGLGWTLPTLLSGQEIAFQPFMRTEGQNTLVDYQTSLEMVTVEVTILGQSGGSDDIDPMTADVESSEVGRRLLPL